MSNLAPPDAGVNRGFCNIRAASVLSTEGV